MRDPEVERQWLAGQKWVALRLEQQRALHDALVKAFGTPSVTARPGPWSVPSGTPLGKG